MRIVSFRHKGLERFWRDDDRRGLPARYIEKIRAMLTAIAEAENLGEIGKYAGWRLHPLKGDLEGHWSIRVNGNWRLTFRFEGEDAILVDFQDYHGS